MKYEIREPINHSLPSDDVHPYRSGVWRPQFCEYDAWDMDITGKIPDDLNGVYLRNTETALFEPIRRYHPFDGDGMLHAISFEAGAARYRNRFVQTEAFLAEQGAKQSLYAGITEHPGIALADAGWGARTMLKDNASTDVVVHNGLVLASFYQCGELYQLDPRTLETLGKSDWNGRFPVEGVSAHQKLDEHTGELLFFNYSTKEPYMHYGVLGADGALSSYIDVPLPGPRLPHDIAFTKHWTIVNDLPLGWDPEALAAGQYSNRFYRELPSRFGLVPRHGGTEDIRWFEASPTFVLHWINAYEDGDEVVLDGFYQHYPTARGVQRRQGVHKGFETLDMNVLEARAHRWRFNLVNGTTTEEQLSERCAEFPMINGRYAGRKHRYAYECTCAPELFALNGLIKHDMDSGTEELVEFEDGVFISETVMAPRDNATAEDDGYLLTFTSDVPNDLSECLIFEAASPGDGPIARVRLPERICSGTHATWAPATSL